MLFPCQAESICCTHNLHFWCRARRSSLRWQQSTCRLPPAIPPPTVSSRRPLSLFRDGLIGESLGRRHRFRARSATSTASSTALSAATRPRSITTARSISRRSTPRQSGQHRRWLPARSGVCSRTCRFQMSRRARGRSEHCVLLPVRTAASLSPLSVLSALSVFRLFSFSLIGPTALQGSLHVDRQA